MVEDSDLRALAVMKITLAGHRMQERQKVLQKGMTPQLANALLAAHRLEVAMIAAGVQLAESRPLRNGLDARLNRLAHA